MYIIKFCSKSNRICKNHQLYGFIKKFVKRKIRQKNSPKDSPDYSPKDSPEDSPKDLQKDSTQDSPKDSQKDSLKYSSKDSSNRQAYKEPQETSRTPKSQRVLYKSNPFVTKSRSSRLARGRRAENLTHKEADSQKIYGQLLSKCKSKRTFKRIVFPIYLFYLPINNVRINE